MSWFSDQYNNWILKKAYKWGKSRATHKLKVFKTFQENFPEMSNRELYYLTISVTPDGFSERKADRVMNLIENGFKPINDTPLHLQKVVKSMLIVEGRELYGIGRLPHPDFIYEAHRGVESVIPDNI